MKVEPIRNIAIIAHVDHGKTTLVDAMLKQCGAFRDNQAVETCVLDSNVLERERGITILAKNIALHYGEVKINLIDTPGHADFGGEVERVLQMADGVVLLVDAVEGPMAQTSFVLRKALQQKLPAIVVINKMDRNGARPDWVLDRVFDLFVDLGATDEQADFPVLYASGVSGWSSPDVKATGGDLTSLFEMIVSDLPAPENDPNEPFRLLVSNIEHNDFVGRIAVGRIFGGTVAVGQQVTLLKHVSREEASGSVPNRVAKLYTFSNLGREEVDSASAGDIVAMSGIDGVDIADTIACSQRPLVIAVSDIDAPTLSMVFQANDSPFAGKEGTFVTGNQLRDRLWRELSSNVALRLEEEGGQFRISGRGLLHLSILIETLRREGYEMQVGKPEVILHHVNGRTEEPVERLTIQVPEQHMGAVMEIVGTRKAVMERMDNSQGGVELEYLIPSRGLIGLRSKLLGSTRGEAVMHHLFDHYAPFAGQIVGRTNGVIVANSNGRATAYAIWKLEDRGTFFINPGPDVYEGMIVGLHNRDNDLTVNIARGKQLTNVRASGSDDAIQLRPPVIHSLEDALAFIEEDELVEITPKAIRLRKRRLREQQRKRPSST